MPAQQNDALQENNGALMQKKGAGKPMQQRYFVFVGLSAAGAFHVSGHVQVGTRVRRGRKCTSWAVGHISTLS